MISVAIVDDEPFVCSSIGRILTGTGTAQVLWSANDGEAAVANCRRHAPDVLLIDVQMPGIDGLEAAERILQDEGRRGELPPARPRRAAHRRADARHRRP